ncbi:YdcF family protein, partial [Alphaproteobacteria bacterium]|nr:YdcF family protein [Alphaproteobacteria bacterium]
MTRAPHAGNLIKDGYSSRVMITNMKWHQLPFGLTYPSDIQMAKKILRKYNLNNELEILPNLKPLGVSSTFDEAYDLRDYLSKNKLKNIILVTDENHSRRALMAFKKIINNLSQVNITV